MMPRFRSYLGCGEPPTAEATNPDERLLWDWTEDGEELLSPFARSEAGLSPYENFGLGRMTASWEWCPMWWAEFDESTIEGEDVLVALRRAQRWSEKGSLADLLGSAPTQCTIAGIDLLDALDGERSRLAFEDRKQEEAKRVRQR